MLISRERMRIVGNDASAILDGSSEIHGNAMITALLRAIIVNRTEWTIETLRDGSKIGLIRASSNSDLDSIMTESNGYPLMIVETRNGYFPSEYSREGWKALDGAPYPVSKYLSQFAKTRVFVNEGAKKVAAVVERNASNVWLQAFVSTFPRVFTWYFTTDLSAEEQSFFRNISVGNKEISADKAEDAFVEYVNAAADKIDFRSLMLHKYLDNYEKDAREKTKSDRRREVEDILRTIRNYQNSLSEYYSRLTDAQRVLKSIEDAPDKSSTELFDFFNSHKCIDVIHAIGDEIKFGITEDMDFYDDDEFARVFARKTSYLYSATSSKDIQKVLHAIFAEHKGVFVVNAVFTLTGLGYINMYQEMSNNGVMPHPHIYFFQCSGGNDQYYSKYAEEGEWQLAIEQAIGATKNLNFGDSTVVSKMIRWIEGHKECRCIRLAGSDTVVSVNEFIKLLNEGDKDNG